MINTHEKLVEKMMENKTNKKELFILFKTKGYKGREKDVIVDMLGAVGDTTLLLCNETSMNSKERTEKEYFEILIREMNINY